MFNAHDPTVFIPKCVQLVECLERWNRLHFPGSIPGSGVLPSVGNDATTYQTRGQASQCRRRRSAGVNREVDVVLHARRGVNESAVHTTSPRSVQRAMAVATSIARRAQRGSRDHHVGCGLRVVHPTKV